MQRDNTIKSAKPATGSSSRGELGRHGKPVSHEAGNCSIFWRSDTIRVGKWSWTGLWPAQPCLTVLVLLAAVLYSPVSQAQSEGLPWVDSIRKSLEDEVAMKTLGGRQFWGDVQFFHDWHIQQNVFTGHYRLLDGRDHRHASGTLEQCRAALNRIRTEKQLKPMSGRGIVLIHGILRSSKCMSTVAAVAQQAGYETYSFSYPSTQVSIPQAADYLHQTIESLEGIEELDIICHSMGGLVTRAYFAEHRDPRIRRAVLIGTPNRGAELADLLYRNFLVRAASGPGGRQLVTDPEGLIPTLPVPPCEFAVIAGGRGNSSGWNPFIPGDDDGTVTVDSTRLVGAADFEIVPSTHTALLGYRPAIDHALHFLATGQLQPDRPRQPIEPPLESPVPETP